MQPPRAHPERADIWLLVCRSPGRNGDVAHAGGYTPEPVSEGQSGCVLASIGPSGGMAMRCRGDVLRRSRGARGPDQGAHA